MAYRNPFPSSGLGIRIPDEIKKEYTVLLRQTDAFSIEKLRSAITPTAAKADTTSPARPSLPSCRTNPSASWTIAALRLRGSPARHAGQRFHDC